MSDWEDFLRDFGLDLVTEFSDKPIGYKVPVKMAGPGYSLVKDFEKLAPDAPGVEYRIAGVNEIASVAAGAIVSKGAKPALGVIAEMAGFTLSAPTATVIAIGLGVATGVAYALNLADDVRETVLNMLEDPLWLFKADDVLTVTLPNGETIRAAVGTNGPNVRNLNNNWFGPGFSAYVGLGGDDELQGNDQDNYLWGDDGNDTLIGSSGNDDLSGGDGIDRVDYSGANSGALVNLTTGLALAGINSADRLSEIEEVLGTGYDDVIIGNVQNNLLMGEGGKDRLEGVGGHNILDGGADWDVIIGGDDGDTLIGGSGADIITAGKGDDVVYLGAVSDYDTLAYFPDMAADRVIYKGGHDQVLGSDGVAGQDAVVIDSGHTAQDASVSHAGVVGLYDFTVSLDDGNSLFLDSWGDVLYTNNLQFTDGSVLAYVPQKNGTFTGGDKNDLLIGGTGATTLIGGLGNDWMTGGMGKDSLDGGLGDDVLWGGIGKVSTEAGYTYGPQDFGVDDGVADTLIGGAGEDTIYAGVGDETDAQAGIDHLYGTAGAQTLKGGADTDGISGGGAPVGLFDYLVGGEGADIFEFNTRSIIMDATTEDFISWGGFGTQIPGGSQLPWMEGGYAYYSPFSGLSAIGGIIPMSSLLGAQSVLTDLRTGPSFRFGLTESDQLLIQFGRGRGGVMVLNDYDLDVETGIGTGNVAVYKLRYVDGKASSLGQYRELANLALKAGFGVGIGGADPLILDMDGDGLELSREVNSEAYVDMDADGYAEHTAWVKKDDALRFPASFVNLLHKESLIPALCEYAQPV